MNWYSRRRAGRSQAIRPLLLALGVALGSSAMAAPVGRTAEQPIDLDLRGVPLGIAVTTISLQSGAQNPSSWTGRGRCRAGW